MKILKLPCETQIKCDLCGCEFEFDFSDICIDKEIIRNLAGNIVNSPTLYVVCPFCGIKREIIKKGE